MSYRAEAPRAKRDTLGWDRATRTEARNFIRWLQNLESRSPSASLRMRQPRATGKLDIFVIRVMQLVRLANLCQRHGAHNRFRLCGTRYDQGGNGSMSFIPKRRGLLSIFASLLLAGGLAGGIVSSTASPPRRNPR